MRTKFTFKTHKLFAVVALMAALFAAKASKAQAQFEPGRTYYVNGIGNDLAAPKDTFVSLAGSGTYYTGGAYTAATGIFPALNVNGIDSTTTGQITILLVPGYGAETLLPILKGVPFASLSRLLVLKPFGTQTITRIGSFLANEPVIRLDGAQFFTIDGESTMGQRNLTILPPATAPAQNHKIIEIGTNVALGSAVSAVNTITIKNTNLRGLSSSNQATTRAGVYAGGVATWGSGSRRAENISVINCNIQNVQHGVYIRGLSSGSSTHDMGLVIKDNIIGGEVGTVLGSTVNAAQTDQHLGGISIGNQANVLIEGNTISGLSPSANIFAGIFVSSSIISGNQFSTDSIITINANKIYNLKSTFVPSIVHGIRFNHTMNANHLAPFLQPYFQRPQNLNYKITNNVISNISSSGTSNTNYLGTPTILTLNPAVLPAVPPNPTPPPYQYVQVPTTANFPTGISLEEDSGTVAFNIYNNSIAMWDEGLRGSASACIYVGFNVTGGIKLMNNILSNRMKNAANDDGAYLVAGVIVNSVSQPFDSIDNNVYDISTTGGWAFTAKNLSRNFVSLNDWRAFTRDDENSLTVKPVFSDPVTLSTLNGAGTTYGTHGKTLLPFDVTGAARPAANHSIGAYQFTQNTSLAHAPLQGGSTYMINGITSLPTNSNLSGSFKNLADFVSHLNSYGTLGNDTIKVIFDNGYNTSVGDSLDVIPAVIAYPGMSPIRKIVLSVAPGVSVNVKLGSTVKIPGNSAVFRLLGVSDFNINGKGSNGQRAITFSLSDVSTTLTSKVLMMSASNTLPSSRNTVTYCNLLGNALARGRAFTTSSPAVYTSVGLYLGDPFPVNPFVTGSAANGLLIATGLGNSLFGPNLNNTITNNFIGGVRNGIYWSAKDSTTDQLSLINTNIIGGAMIAPGDTGRVYVIGGALLGPVLTTPANSGIYIKGLSTSTIDSNIVRNSHSGHGAFMGIFLNGSTTIGRSKDLLVTKNTIYNLGSINAAPGYSIGIRIALNEAGRGIRIQNNFITKIFGAGGASFSTVTMPAGIAIDPINVSSSVNLGINISHNTVNLPAHDVVELASGQYSTAFFIGERVAGLRVVNNIFANTSGRKSSFGGTTTVAIAFGGLSRANSADAFTLNEGNVYYANGRFSGNFVGLKNTTNPNAVLNTITELRAYSGFNNLSAFGEVPFLNDTTITMNPYYIGHIVKNRNIFTEPTVDKDITGAARPAGINNTSVGALHIDPLTAYEPLYGGQTYQVSGVLNPPAFGQQTGQFNTINNLFRYINTNGVDHNDFPQKTITIEITPGYAGEGDTSIFPLMKYPLMSFFRKIIIKPAAGASPVIASTAVSSLSAFDATSSVIRMQGAANITIDGSNNGSNSRDLTIRMPLPISSPSNYDNIKSQTARVIDVMGWELPAEDITIKNCNIVGNSTSSAINTYAGIYQGGIIFGQQGNVLSNPIRIRNSRNAYVNNYITAVKHGIYLRGGVVQSAFDSGTLVMRNIIGGNINVGGSLPTDYFGNGIAISAPSPTVIPNTVYASAIAAFTQYRSTIDSNVIQNVVAAVPTNVNASNGLGNAGIEIGALSTGVKVSRNIIRGIRATHLANNLVSPAYGIYVNGPWNEKRSITIENNMISKIAGTLLSSSSVTGLTLGTYGIYLDGTPNINIPAFNTTHDSIDVNIYHNSINLTAGAGDDVSGIAACIGANVAASGNIRIENNILQNTMARRTTLGFNNNYIYHSADSGYSFGTVDNNNYFVSSPNGSSNMALINTYATPSTTVIGSLAAWAFFNKQDTLSLNYRTTFTNDSNLFIADGTVSPMYRGGRRIPAIPTDLIGTARPAGLSATMGAHEFNGIFADSMAPKQYDYTTLPSFCQPDGAPIEVIGRVLDRNPVLADTLYYTLNGTLPEMYVLPTTIDGHNRIYHIPGQPINTLIAYRIAAVDGALKKGDFVNSNRATGNNYATSTIGNFPIYTGFDAPNIFAFKTQKINKTGWNIESNGSQTNPFLFPRSGAKAAMLLGDTLNAGRILTPCLDFTNVKLPVIRLYVSQNSDRPDRNDSIVIKKWYAFDSYTPVVPFNPIRRVNPNPNAAPGYKVYDVCLADPNLIGSSGFKISVEGYGLGGSNLIIDSIILLDNFVDHDVAAVDQNSCFNDSFSIQISNTSPQNEYYLFDDISGRVVGQRGILGNGGTLTLKGYMSTVDSARIKAMYTNITAMGCEVDPNNLTKYVSISFNTFKNGPFVKRGNSFYGMLNEGTISNPDAVRVGGTADFEMRPPGTATSADYGISWSVAKVELRNYMTNQLNTTAINVVPGTASTPALIRFTGAPGDSNQLFKMTIILRLLPRGCDSVIVRYVRVANAPVATFYTLNDTLCQGQGVLFYNYTSNGVFSLPVTYRWDFGDGDSSAAITPVKKFASPGIYTVKLIASNTTTLEDSMSFTFVVNPAPSASYTYSTPCSYKPVTFTNTSTIGNGITYAWNIAGQLRTDTSPVLIIPYSDTLVSVRLVVKNADGCTDTAAMATPVFAQPVAAFTANNVCAGAFVQFNNASTIDPGKENRKNEIGYEWDFGNGAIGDAEDPLYKYPAGGNYSVRLKVISNFGCTDTISAPVSIFAKPVSAFTFDNTCKASPVSISNNSTYSGGLDKVLYRWNFGDNSQPSTLAVPNKQYGEARKFFVTLVVTDTVNYCSDSITNPIEVKESAKAEFTADNGCVNVDVRFTNVSVIPAGVNPTYSWDFGDQTTASVPSPTHPYASGGLKPVAFTVNIDGCKSVALDTISISDASLVTFTPSTVDSNTYSFVATPATFSKYQWKFGDETAGIEFGYIGGPGQNTAENTYAREGTYRVVLVATDANGCSATADSAVRVARTVGFKEDLLTAKFKFNVYPNPFSAGAKVIFEMDARNDVTLDIYDMLGRKVYTKNEGELSAGKHSINFDESDFAAKAGAYLVKVKIGDQIITRQLIKQQ